MGVCIGAASVRPRNPHVVSLILIEIENTDEDQYDDVVVDDDDHDDELMIMNSLCQMSIVPTSD